MNADVADACWTPMTRESLRILLATNSQGFTYIARTPGVIGFFMFFRVLPRPVFRAAAAQHS